MSVYDRMIALKKEQRLQSFDTLLTLTVHILRHARKVGMHANKRSKASPAPANNPGLMQNP